MEAYNDFRPQARIKQGFQAINGRWCMAFKVLFLAHAPDAVPEKHASMVETGKYKLFVRAVKSQSEALEACQNLVKKEGIHSILLCPGFTHANIAEIVEAAGTNVGVFVARGDPPSTRLSLEVMAREGWFGVTA
jgi:hypothetical protein